MNIPKPPRWLLPLLAAAAACQTVPYTRRSHLVLVSAEEEAALGETSYKDALSTAKLSTAAAAKPDSTWEFNLIDDPNTVTAWCLPGGTVPL